MKNLLITILVVLSQFAVANSGFEDYTYQKDKSFNDIRQLQGQTFVPQAYSKSSHGKTQVEAGKVKIHIGNSMVHIEGVPSLGSFNIIAAASTRVGYEFKIMDNRGYHSSKMKVVLDRNNFVELVYIYSKKSGEFTFFLPNKTQKDLEKERAYFSNKKSVLIDNEDDLENLSLVPYKQTVGINNPSALTEKISMKKGVSFKVGTKYVTIKSGGKEESYKLKKSKIELVSLKNQPQITESWELKTEGRKNNIKMFLNEKSEIEFFDVNNVRYSLL